MRLLPCQRRRLFGCVCVEQWLCTCCFGANCELADCDPLDLGRALYCVISILLSAMGLIEVDHGPLAYARTLRGPGGPFWGGPRIARTPGTPFLIFLGSLYYGSILLKAEGAWHFCNACYELQ